MVLWFFSKFHKPFSEITKQIYRKKKFSKYLNYVYNFSTKEQSFDKKGNWNYMKISMTKIFALGNRSIYDECKNLTKIV